jgi:hypothetical protein
MDKLEAIEELCYFHNERGDMERYCDFGEALKMFPDIERAFKDYKYHERLLGIMLSAERDRLNIEIE